ncbi:hypothetical protein FRC12_000113 [Ceratobasidium sp. 428]|nr:hypothetical protein FRC12_000113 [Ceratobasidium sp. 428]
MAAVHPPVESRDLGEWTQLHDDEQSQDEEDREERRKRKGKSKDSDFKEVDAEMGMPQDGAMPNLDEREEEGGVDGSYPPVSEEAAEERQVVENLKRWEVAERLRRKAMRESRSLSTGSAVPSPVAALGRRASLLLFRRSTGSNRDTSTRLRTDSPTPLDDLEHQRRSLTRIETADTGRNPFRDPSVAESDAAVALMTPASTDPFEQKKHGRTDSMSTVTGGTGPVQPTPQRPILQASGSSMLFTQEPGSVRVPPPRPLDIPTTPVPQHRYEGGGPVPVRMSSPQEAMRARRTVAQIQEDEEEFDREQRDGRWWTDWLCGLKERKDPNGQGGRTNPFE